MICPSAAEAASVEEGLSEGFEALRRPKAVGTKILCGVFPVCENAGTGRSPVFPVEAPTTRLPYILAL